MANLAPPDPLLDPFARLCAAHGEIRWTGTSEAKKRVLRGEMQSLEAALKKLWSERLGLVEMRGGALHWPRLFGKGVPRDGIGEGLPRDDHVSLWRQGGERHPCVWVSQPYALAASDLGEMARFAEAHALDFSIATWPAWHYPGSVLFVEWTTAAYRARRASLLFGGEHA